MEGEAILTKASGAASMRGFSTTPLPVTSRPVPTVLLILYSLLLALGLGLGSAYLALSGDPPFGSLRVGPWTVWPRLGSPAADPYMRAIIARRGDVPLATGEGIALSARVDSSGQALDSNCSYRVGSAMPAARLWTLTLYDEAGRLLVSELGRSSFTSAEIVRDADDRFTIALSRNLQPGNWLQLPPSGSFQAVLRLYDPPGAAAAILSESTFPGIERIGCGA
jgi:hypothetical protein